MMIYFLRVINRFLDDVTALFLALFLTIPMAILYWFGFDYETFVAKVFALHTEFFDWKILNKSKNEPPTP